MLNNIAKLRRITKELSDFSYTEDPFRIIVDKTADGIIVVDDKGIVYFMNPMAEAMFKCKSKDKVGKPIDIPWGKDVCMNVDVSDGNGGTISAEVRTVQIQWSDRIMYLSSIRAPWRCHSVC